MPTRKITSIACFLALLGAAGIGHAANLSKADRSFMIAAANNDMTEAHEGQMAEKQALRNDVKDLARTVVKDHTDSYEHLTELAAKAGVSIPKGINAGRGPAMQLVHLKGDRFDRQFTREDIAADRQTIVLFKHEATHGSDADVKAYAEKMIPVLEHELQLAEACAKPVKRS